jgi:hypothetical protein
MIFEYCVKYYCVKYRCKVINFINRVYFNSLQTSIDLLVESVIAKVM